MSIFLVVLLLIIFAPFSFILFTGVTGIMGVVAIIIFGILGFFGVAGLLSALSISSIATLEALSIDIKSTLFIVIIVFIAIFTLRKIHNLMEANKALLALNNTLQNENIELKLKAKYAEKAALDTKEFKDIYTESLKANMLEFNNKLMSQVLETNKTEGDKIKENTNGQITIITENFKKHFTDVVEKISFISKDFSDSKTAIDIIKKNIFNPVGAGKFTEITLENILRKSGLIEEIDFFIQKHISFAKSSEFFDVWQGEQQNEVQANIRPDAIVLLPNNHLLIIDAKAFKSDENRLNEDPKQQETFKRNFLAHLKSLSSKEYDQKIKNIKINDGSLDKNFDKVTILMFLASEDLAMHILLNETLLSKCIENNIMPVGPSGLLNILSIYKFYIENHKKEQNYELIIKELEALISSIGKTTENIVEMSKNINNFNHCYNKFVKLFNSQIVTKAQSISSLGVATNNKIKTLSLESSVE